MPISARVILDSIQPEGVRLTTLVARIPKPIQAEFNTHRESSRGDGQLANWLDLSRNSASSRAIPVEKMIQSVLDDPYIPRFTRNQKGMQGSLMAGHALEKARDAWLAARDEAIDRVRDLLVLEVHKQDANRLIEPFMHVDVVVSSVAWANFHAQRIHPMAHPAMQDIASAICAALGESIPKSLYHGDWHLPFIMEEDRALVREKYQGIAQDDGAMTASGLVAEELTRVSAARCARVSYMTHDGRRDLEEDLALFQRLVDAQPMHGSPLEHVAQAARVMLKFGEGAILADPLCGNYRHGWRQLRKQFQGEYVG